MRILNRWEVSTNLSKVEFFWFHLPWCSVCRYSFDWPQVSLLCTANPMTNSVVHNIFSPKEHLIPWCIAWVWCLRVWCLRALDTRALSYASPSQRVLHELFWVSHLPWTLKVGFQTVHKQTGTRRTKERMTRYYLVLRYHWQNSEVVGAYLGGKYIRASLR